MRRASRLGRDNKAVPEDAMSTAHVALQGTVSALQTSADTPGGATWREYDEILSREIAETRANKPAYKPVDWHRYPLLSRDWARPAEWKAGRLLQGRDLDSRFYDARAECLAILTKLKCYDHVSLVRSLIHPVAVLEVLQRGRWRDSNQWGVSCRREIADMPAIVFQIDAPGAENDYAAGETDFAGIIDDLATRFAAA